MGHFRIVASFVAWGMVTVKNEELPGTEIGVSASAVTDNLTAAILSRRCIVVKKFLMDSA
jgi:hypothetical protein